MPPNTLEDIDFAAVAGKVGFEPSLCSVRCEGTNIYFLLGMEL